MAVTTKNTSQIFRGQNTIQSQIESKQASIKNQRGKFLWDHITPNDNKPEDYKVQTINKMPQPTNVRDLRCFLAW